MNATRTVAASSFANLEGGSGDRAFAFVCPDGTEWLFVCDVAGRGPDVDEPASFLADAVRTLLCQGMSPALTMRTLDHAFAHCFASRALFASAFLAWIEPDRLGYVSAGHGDALIVNGSRHRHLAASGPLLGIFASADYDERFAALWPGDVLAVSTDGLIEAQGRDGERLWLHGLAKHVQLAVPGEPGTLAERIVRDVAHGYDLHDDHAIATYVVASANP